MINLFSFKNMNLFVFYSALFYHLYFRTRIYIKRVIKDGYKIMWDTIRFNKKIEYTFLDHDKLLLTSLITFSTFCLHNIHTYC